MKNFDFNRAIARSIAFAAGGAMLGAFFGNTASLLTASTFAVFGFFLEP